MYNECISLELIYFNLSAQEIVKIYHWASATTD